MPQIRITARGVLPSLALLGGIILLPYLLAGSLSLEDAEAKASDFHERRAVMSILDGSREATPVQWQRIETEIETAKSTRLSSVRVRRSLVVPPLSRRTAFLIQYHVPGATEPVYLRVRGAYVYEVSPFWWHVRI